MFPLFRCRHALVAAVVVAAAVSPARAQDDPPGRVARLNYVSGQVSFRPATLEEWTVATVNYPLTTGDHLWTERTATAELHVSAAVIRLAPETAFSFLNLDDNLVQARLAEGTLDLRVRELYEGEIYEVDTPNAAISIVRPGIYHIDVDPGGERTRITVRDGEAEVDCGHRLVVTAGRSAELIGVEDVASVLSRAAAPDRWELWCRDRDRREDNRLALNYVSRDMVGYEDLDDYGTWSYVPEYGDYAWEPTIVAVDWAPYRYGRWSWVRPWGWTWIDDARWGFAPFHYGRWTCYHDRWVWLPGHRHDHPVYAPALVAFVGHRNWMYSFSFGTRSAVGWFPLGPGEPYCPSYHASGRYLRNVNVNVANVAVTTNLARLRYANRDVPGAMTAVPRDVFTGSQSVHRVGTAVPRALAQQAPVVGHGAPVTATSTSVAGYVPASAARPPVDVMRRAVVVRNEPPADATAAAPVVSTAERAARRPRPDVGRPATPAYAAAGTTDSRSDARGEAAEARSVVVGQGVVGARPESDVRSDKNSYMYLGGSDRPASARPRGDQSAASNDLRATGGATEARPPAGENEQSARPRYDQPTYSAPRYEAPRYNAPSYEAPRYQAETPRAQAVPREDRPAPSAERSTPPREERTAPVYERPAQREERRESSGGGASASARPRSDESHAAPASSSSSSPSPAANRPAERAAERPAPKSDSNQSNQSERPKPGGGRGGQAKQ